MSWKQDLSKLKQQLKEEPPAPPPPAPKKAAPALPPASMAEEDALFLSAMGMRPAAPPRPRPAETPAQALPVVQEVDFTSAMAGLGGLKPLARKLPEAKPAMPQAPPVQVQPAVEGAAEPEPAPVTVPVSVPAPPAELPPPGRPLRIHLAAGMAIEVDGHLDLRGHSVQDATERLRDRLEDAKFMHWRSLHVTLGLEAGLHEALQELLQSGGLPLVHRYAQAPIPMGGAQAWILYLTA